MEQCTRFLLDVGAQPEAALTQADCELLLFELQSRLQDRGWCKDNLLVLVNASDPAVDQCDAEPLELQW